MVKTTRSILASVCVTLDKPLPSWASASVIIKCDNKSPRFMGPLSGLKGPTLVKRSEPS